MKLLRLSVVLLCLFIVKNGFAQTDSLFLGRAVKSLEKYTEAYPVEKVYLHIDRSSYSPGDTIWFKAYTVAGTNHALSAISNVLHVEFTTAKDSVISRIAIPLGSAVGWGDFVVPATVRAGNYQIRAYTNWMRNFEPEYFFSQQIQVTDIPSLKTVKKKKNTGDPDVQFFPEGGELVNGLRSKVAIKCVNANGLGEDASGSIIDNDGNEVSVFTTQHLGMGIFALLPQPGKTYTAKITSQTGRQFTVKLPKANNDGFTLSVNNNGADSISVRVAASEQLFGLKKNSQFYLVAQASGKVYFTAALNLTARSFTTQVDKKRFPTGIAQFTLFAGDGEPLNERVAFIQHNDGLKLDIVSDKKTYPTRGKVMLTLKTSDKDSKPVVGSFSASITSNVLEDVNDADRGSVFSNLLLTADIKGYVEKPGYYFSQVNNKTQADLDVLMLTQGYHRFDWKQVTAGMGLPINFDPESTLSVTGYLKTNGGKPVIKGKVLLYKTKGGWFKADTLTDERGRFVIDNLVADGDTTLTYIVQGRTGLNGKNVVISIDTIAPFPAPKAGVANNYTALSDSATTATSYQLQLKQQMKISLDRRLIQLKEVVIKENKESVKDIVSHAVNPDQVVSDFPKKETGETLRTFLAGKLRGVTARKQIDGTFFYSTRSFARSSNPTPMMIKLNGMVIDGTAFESLALTDIESAEVIRTTGKMDMTTGATEVIYLNTRKNFAFNRPVTPDVTTFSSGGLYKARTFYAPKYDKPADLKPDLRATIYWKPDILTDKDGKATLVFYNADVTGDYKVIVEGVDVNGNLGRQVFVYKVE